MKPPVCHLCRKHLELDDGPYLENGYGDLVKFMDYRPLPLPCVGHPHGLEWFCKEHIAAAKKLSYLDAKTALHQLQVEFDIAENPPMRWASDATLWITSVGPNKAKVFRLIRQMMSLKARAAKALLDKEEFMVTQGWPSDFSHWRNELEQAGAAIEVRCDGERKKPGEPCRKSPS